MKIMVIALEHKMHLYYSFYKNDYLNYLKINVVAGLALFLPNKYVKTNRVYSSSSDWKSDKRQRTRAPPHIKTYCRVSDDHKEMYYFVLTSANMSKAAWGQQAKSGSLNILSYEAGVLFIPRLMVRFIILVTTTSV